MGASFGDGNLQVQAPWNGQPSGNGQNSYMQQLYTLYPWLKPPTTTPATTPPPTTTPPPAGTPNSTGFTTSPIPTNPAYTRTYAGPTTPPPIPGAQPAAALGDQIAAQKAAAGQQFAPLNNYLQQVQAAPRQLPFGLLGSGAR
jgi:hypothetical protein